MTTDNGGPAFPRPETVTEGLRGEFTYRDAQDGMSLRDWFAGLAMQATVTTDAEDVRSEKSIAETAFNIADAMLAEKKRRDGT